MAFEQQTTALLTKDVARELSFFVKVFGYEVALDIGWFASLRDAKTGSTLDLWSADHESARHVPAGTSAGFVIGYVFEDVAAAEKQALSAGATVVQPVRDEPWGQRHVLVRTPGGAVLDLVQRIAPDPAWLAANGLG